MQRRIMHALYLYSSIRLHAVVLSNTGRAFLLVDLIYYYYYYITFVQGIYSSIPATTMSVEYMVLQLFRNYNVWYK